MKKFYSFLLAAVALVGFAACNQDFTADITPESGEMVSFKATIADETRVGLDGLQTVWVAGDKVMVDGYTFICKSDLQTFVCTEVGCSELLEEGRTVEAVYAANFDLSGEGVIDSTKGTEGAVLKANGSLTDGTLSFQIQSAFLKFTTTSSNVVLNTADGDELFSHLPINVDALTAAEDGSYYVAINPVSATLSYSINGIECKKITKDFVAGKIYNLGALDMPEVDVHVMVKDLGWSDVYMVVGDKATKITETKTINSNTFYTAKVTLGSKISFRNGENATNDKRMVDTDFDGNDITIAKKDTYLRLSVRGAVDIDPNDVSTFRYGICVFDQKNKQKAPNLYTWNDGDAFKSMHGGNFGSWPGVAFKDEAYYKPADGNGWKRYYYYEIPTSRYNSGFKFIVNKSGQTADLSVSKVTGDLYVGYWFDSDSSNGFWANSPYTTIIEE